MMSALDGLILKLHADCRGLPLNEFQDWALNLIDQLVPFDQVVWGSGVLLNGFPQIRDNFLRGLGPDFIVALNKNFHLDLKISSIAQQSGVTFNRDGHSPTEVPLEFRQRVLDPSNTRYTLSTLFVEPGSAVFAGLSLNRLATAMPFRESERQLVERIVPHLINAYTANQIARAQDILDAGLNASYNSLVATPDGIIIAVEPGAKLMLQAQWPDWKGGILPQTLLEKISANLGESFGQGFLFENFYARAYRNTNRLLLRLRHPNVLDTLGQRERSVAEKFAKGDSCKEIAKIFGVSPSTVNNQVSQIYRKLSISSKGELATKLLKLL
jgi:DNA-binding CsgD family transcriptional regulator